MIHSLLDTDLYKFTMMQAVLHQYPAAHAEHRFRCRSPGVDLARHIDAVSDAIDALCALRFRADELDYLRGLRFIAPDFVDFLGPGPRPRPRLRAAGSPRAAARTGCRPPG